MICTGFPGGSGGRIRLQCGRPRFDPWVEKIPWRRAWQPTPVFWPGESHGQRSLVSYSPWGCKELDTTEWLTLSLSFSIGPYTLIITLNVNGLNAPTKRHRLSGQMKTWACMHFHLPHHSFDPPYCMQLFYAAAAKLLQSCLTLCDPIDGSPPGPDVPGILQARTLEWVAISSCNAWKWSHSFVSDS